MMKTSASHYQSPLGEVLLLATEVGLSGFYFTGQRYFPQTDPAWQWEDTPFVTIKLAIAAYFQKGLSPFNLSLHLYGTSFQKRVWHALNQIPAGETRSYGEIARQIGAATAVRAVGTAIGRNPVSVIVPCHRVVGSRGKLTGYAGGLDRKAWLLSHENNDWINHISTTSDFNPTIS
jgi:methylated-DNA-[protein]-cysteine S-methyltransferase